MRLQLFERPKIRLFIMLLVSAWVIVTPIKAQQGLRIIFLHHSCGTNLIHQGKVREGLTSLGYQFFDHGYNGDGLCLADGQCPGTNFDVPGDNTDPDGIAEIFNQSLHEEPDNTFSYLMQYDVIVFKSCYPTSNVTDEAHLDQNKAYYLAIRDRMDQYPNRIFIVVTQPPQVPGSSNRAEAHRARELAEWLSSEAFLDGHPNVFTFDFFSYLVAEDNFLRAEYRVDNHDAHPNSRANREIGPHFVSFIDTAIRTYKPGVQQPLVVPITKSVVSATPLATLPAEDIERDDPPVDSEAADQQGGKGIGNLPCPSSILPLMLLTVAVVGKYNQRVKP